MNADELAALRRDFTRARKVDGDSSRRRTYPAGRVCNECDAKLSRYNPAPTCYLHTPQRRPRPRAR